MSKKSKMPKLAEMKVSEEFKTEFGTVGCYIENFGEMLQTVDADYGEEGKVKIPASKFPSLLIALYDKVREALLKCEEKELLIDFGDSAAANTIESLVELLIKSFRNNNNE